MFLSLKFKHVIGLKVYVLSTALSVSKIPVFFSSSTSGRTTVPNLMNNGPKLFNGGSWQLVGTKSDKSAANSE